MAAVCLWQCSLLSACVILGSIKCPLHLLQFLIMWKGGCFLPLILFYFLSRDEHFYVVAVCQQEGEIVGHHIDQVDGSLCVVCRQRQLLSLHFVFYRLRDVIVQCYFICSNFESNFFPSFFTFEVYAQFKDKF